MTQDTAPRHILDQEKLITGAASKVIDRLLSAAEEKFRNEWAKRRNSQLKGLTALIKNQTATYSKIKNILYYNESVPLNDLYVSLNLEKSEVPHSDDTVFRQAQNGKKIIVNGTAGAGKSFFMRKALLHLSSSVSVIPIFFELRSLNDVRALPFLSALLNHVNIFLKDFMPEQLHLGLEQGLFVLLLDGFDEIDPDRTESYQRDIITFAKTFPKVGVLVSSRPMEPLQAWQDFELFSIQPLSQPSAISLVQKLVFDNAVKVKFIQAVQRGLYEKHSSFMSVPLLITMMLVTFAETADIDNNLVVFYSEAFNALFVRHDAKKEAFRRKTASGLSREQFKQLFASFCFISYVKKLLRFTEEEALQTIAEAVDLQGITVDCKLYFQDLCITSCMLVREGRYYVFAHRSFQEYFCAFFINGMEKQLALKSIDQIMPRVTGDSVIHLLKDMNPNLVEKGWVLPRVRAINREISRLELREFPTRLVEQWFVFYSAEMGRGGWVQTAGPKGRMGVDLQYILSLYRRGSFMAGYVYERISKKLQLDKLIAHRLVGSIEDLRSAPFEVKLAGRVEFLSSDAKFRERVNSLIDFLEEKMIEIAGREQSRGRKLDRLLKAVSRK